MTEYIGSNCHRQLSTVGGKYYRMVCQNAEVEAGYMPRPSGWERKSQRQETIGGSDSLLGTGGPGKSCHGQG